MSEPPDDVQSFLTRRPTVPAAEEILGRYWPVLDHGFVALVDYLGGDASVERAARNSYQHGTRKVSDTRTLLRHLRRSRHTSPSESTEVVLHCAMPIFVARQLIRHRTFSVSEVSGRYSLLPMLFYTPEPAQLALQSATNRQGRDAASSVDPEHYARRVRAWNEGRARDVEAYREMTAEGVARELARIDLPLSSYTSWIWKTDLHNLFHFLGLRVDPHAQWETREYARIIAGMVKRLAPLSYEAWIDYEVCAVRFSRHERVALARMLANAAEPFAPIDPTARELEGLDLTARERAEFVAKLTTADDPPPDFGLDLASARTAEHFERRYREAALPEDPAPTG
jgi:thymidylate synthase (FAD)